MRQVKKGNGHKSLNPIGAQFPSRAIAQKVSFGIFMQQTGIIIRKVIPELLVEEGSVSCD